jgi:hypothetical protein
MAAQRMEIETWNVHVFRMRRTIESIEAPQNAAM